MTIIDVQTLCPAAPATVWALLANVTSWSSWGPWNSAVLTSPGAEDAHGVGAVRTLRYRGITSVEEVVEFKPERQLAYVLRRGLPLWNYRAVVTLVPVGDETIVRWTSSFGGPYAWFFAPGLKRFIRRVARDLSRAVPAATT